MELPRDPGKGVGGGPLLSLPGLHSGVPGAVLLSSPTALILT